MLLEELVDGSDVVGDGEVVEVALGLVDGLLDTIVEVGALRPHLKGVLRELLSRTTNAPQNTPRVTDRILQ